MVPLLLSLFHTDTHGIVAAVRSHAERLVGVHQEKGNRLGQLLLEIPEPGVVFQCSKQGVIRPLSCF